MEFTHDEGDIDLFVYDANLELITGSITSNDNESVTVSLRDPERKTIYVLAFFANAGNTYDLIWSGNRLNDSTGNRIDDDWEAAHGLAEDNLDYDSNEDGDRYPLWAEFANGLNPDEYDEPKVEIEQVDGYFEVSFMRNTKAIDAGYQVKVFESTDLRNWDAEAMVHVKTVTEGLPVDMERVTMRSSRSIADESQQFFRLSTIPIPE